MILRKPYAFFIKHFKLFNVILTCLNVYMIYKLSFLFQFFYEYSDNPIGAIGQNLIGTLLNKTFFIVGIVIIVFDFLLIGILSLKKKPIKLYMLNIIVIVGLLILLFISYNILSDMELRIIENRTVFLIRDFTMIIIIFQFVVTIINCMRAIGFDIKSFSFGKDLEELNIDATDNEEFELQIDVDSSKFQRSFNKNKRYIKYFIYEHKFMLVLILTIVIGIVSYIIYSRTGIYFNTVKPNKMVNVDNFVIGVNESYITYEDYRGKKITDNILVAVPITLKVNDSKEKLNIARFKLVVDGKSYYHTTNYNSKLSDLGLIYDNQIIGDEFSSYILVFEIPKNSKIKKSYLQYDTTNEKSIKFRIVTNNIDEVEFVNNYNLNETISLNNEIVKSGTAVINSFEIAKKFKVDYKLCVTNNECYDSYEYIVPNYMNNYDKTILKLNGNINIVDSNTNISNLFDFVDKFGTINYIIDGVEKKQLISFVEVVPSKTKLKNTYYIEILDEISDASSISIEFVLRNTKYIYNLK